MEVNVRQGSDLGKNPEIPAQDSATSSTPSPSLGLNEGFFVPLPSLRPYLAASIVQHQLSALLAWGSEQSKRDFAMQDKNKGSVEPSAPSVIHVLSHNPRSFPTIPNLLLFPSPAPVLSPHVIRTILLLLTEVMSESDSEVHISACLRMFSFTPCGGMALLQLALC